MYQPNVPRKTTALIQVWGCVLLALVCVFLSFAPMITLDTGAGKIESMLDELDLGVEIQKIPEEVDVSAVKLIGSITLVADVVSALSDDASADDKKLADLEALLKTEDGVNTLVMIVAIANTVTDSIDFEGEPSLGMILGILITFLALLFVLIFTLICPIIYIVTALTMLIPALVRVTDPLRVSSKISRKLPGLLTLPMVFIVFQCLIPGMNYGYGALGLWIVAAACVLLNVVVSRLRKYTNKEFIYVTVVQGGALIGAIGYIVYFFNILKTGVFNSFLHGKWADYVLDLGKQQALAEKAKLPFEPSNAYLIDAGLIVVYAILILVSISYFTYCAERLSCAAGNAKKKSGVHENHIVFSIVMLLTCLIPMYVKDTKNLFVNFVDEKLGASSSLVMTPAQEKALETAMVGLIIMIVAEIAIFVLRLVLCKGLTKEERVAVLTGTAPTPDENAEAVVEAPVAEDAAAAAVVETPAAPADAPAKEEAPAEEAPAKEEAPAEEAPAEEAPVKEEAPAEDAPKAE